MDPRTRKGYISLHKFQHPLSPLNSKTLSYHSNQGIPITATVLSVASRFGGTLTPELLLPFLSGDLSQSQLGSSSGCTTAYCWRRAKGGEEIGEIGGGSWSFRSSGRSRGGLWSRSCSGGRGGLLARRCLKGREGRQGLLVGRRGRLRVGGTRDGRRSYSRFVGLEKIEDVLVRNGCWDRRLSGRCRLEVVKVV